MTELRLVTKQRTRNVSKNEQCGWCDDTGFVVASVRQERHKVRVDGELVERLAEYEELGPCPHCERGFAVEFPNLERLKPKDGKPGPGVRPPWDPEAGFWQGRSTSDVRPMVDRQVMDVDEGESAA